MRRSRETPPPGKTTTQVSRRHPGEKSAPEARRDPRQERSRETVAVILQAAAEVFAKLGYAGATTNKIAERAGYSIGSLYQYFANKDEILLVLLERHHEEAHAIIDRAGEKLADRDVPLEQGLRCLLEGLLDMHAQNPALSRVLAHGIHRFEGRRACKDDEDERYVEEVTAILDRRPEVRVEDTRSAALVVVHTVELLIRWLGHDAPRAVDAGSFIDQMLTMLLRYLAPSTPRENDAIAS